MEAPAKPLPAAEFPSALDIPEPSGPAIYQATECAYIRR